MISLQRFLNVSRKIQLEVAKRNINSFILSNRMVVLNQNKNIPSLPIRTMSLINLETMRKVLTAIPFLGFEKTRLKARAYEQFENLVDNTDYMGFFEELDLPDTFYSWFVITELHLWMLSVRAMMEGDDGRLIRNTLVEALWADVLERVKKLDSKSSSVDIRTKIVELSEQLQASYIAYDEGILSEDTVLAGALWRRFYQQADVDVEHLEKLVKYVRKNMKALDNMSTEQFFDTKVFKWGSVTT